MLTLANVKLQCNYLSDFNSNWFAVLDDLPMKLDEHTLMDMYYEQVKNAPCLRDDINFFKSLPHGHPYKTWVARQSHRKDYKSLA